MMDVTTSQTNSEIWRELYVAALFETDREKMPSRIADAEQAIVARARELFSAATIPSKRIKPWMTPCTPCEHCKVACIYSQLPPRYAPGQPSRVLPGCMASVMARPGLFNRFS